MNRKEWELGIQLAVSDGPGAFVRAYLARGGPIALDEVYRVAWSMGRFNSREIKEAINHIHTKRWWIEDTSAEGH